MSRLSLDDQTRCLHALQASGAHPITLELDVASLMTLAGGLQLALRHPDFPATSRALIAHHLTQWETAVGSLDADLALLLQAGNDPHNDVAPASPSQTSPTDAPTLATPMPPFLAELVSRLERADANHAPYDSLHAAYAMLLEEVEEFWDEVKKKRLARNLGAIRRELLDIAVVCWRTVRAFDLEKPPALVGEDGGDGDLL